MKTLKEKILECHKKWLEGMYANIEDYPNSLDIAESANEADFRETMLDNIEGLTKLSENEFNYDNTDYKFGFSFDGLEVEIFENDEHYDDKVEKLNFTIEWPEFDAQMNDYK